MHPFFSTTNRILMLLASWLILTISLCGLVSIVTAQIFMDSVILFAPLYFLLLLFILPNYYVCRGLPLGQTKIVTLLGSHGLTLLVTVAIWLVAGQSYVALLGYLTETQIWGSLFDDSLYINIALVILQFEMFVLIHYLLFALEKSSNLERAALQQKLLISQAELQSLKATVHPHFLFNALNTLSTIALSDPEKAHRFCLLMAEFLRYSVAYSKKSSATLADELEHIQNYLGIERERFGERLKTEFIFDQSLRDNLVPPLILFPLVENAIKHGIDSCIEGGCLRVEVAEHNDTMVIQITNPVDELGRKLKGTGHGLLSVERRLKNRYGERALIKSESKGGLYTTKIYIPIETKQ